MSVLVDTPIWSPSLRHKKTGTETPILQRLIGTGRAVLFGPVKQELLSGYRDERQFGRLKLALDEFRVLLPIEQDYVEAARLSNECRWREVQGSSVDFLICAVSRRLNLMVYTNDQDFRNYAGVFSLAVYEDA